MLPLTEDSSALGWDLDWWRESKTDVQIYSKYRGKQLESLVACECQAIWAGFKVVALFSFPGICRASPLCADIFFPFLFPFSLFPTLSSFSSSSPLPPLLSFLSLSFFTLENDPPPPHLFFLMELGLLITLPIHSFLLSFIFHPSYHFCIQISFLFSFPLFPVHNFHYSTYPLRYPPLRHQDSNCWKSWADLWPGVYGRPHQAGLLLLPFSLQAQARELRERPVTADQLHLPAGLWGHRAGLQNLWLPLVSDSFFILELGLRIQYVEYFLNKGLTLWFSYRNI